MLQSDNEWVTPDVDSLVCRHDFFNHQANAGTGVETDHMSRSAFDKIIPFNVKEQSLRTCLCVNCYKAKLITAGLCENWPTLHHGDNEGDPCSCACDFCKAGCGDFLKYASPKAVFSMGDFSDGLLCPKEKLYIGRTGEEVDGHRLACVSGHCVDCQDRQARFFACPRHQTVTPPLVPSSTAGAAGERSETICWKEFTVVDDAVQPIPRRPSRQGNEADDDDQDWSPSGGTEKARQRKVRVIS